MSKVNWRRLVTQIPNRVQVNKKDYYEVLWVDGFTNELTLGETRFDLRQIVLKKNQSPKQTIVTFMHELVHCFFTEHDIHLTETDVLKTEKFFYYILKPDNIFKGK